MKFHRMLLASLLLTVLFIGCTKDEDDTTTTPHNALHTLNIKDAPVYVNLTTGDSTSVWEISYTRTQASNFRVNGGINGGKGVKGVRLTTTFAATSTDTAGLSWTTDVDSTHLLIGGVWANFATYNPADHSFSGYDTTVWVLKYDAYPWIKFHPTSYNGSGTVRFEYAFSDSVKNGFAYWGTARTDSIVIATSGQTKYFRFGVGSVEDNAWQLGMLAAYEPTPNGPVRFPYGRLNSKLGVQAAWVNTTYDNVTTVPSNVTWLSDTDSLCVGRIFNYNDATHQLTAFSKTLLVKQGGQVWKVVFENYYGANSVGAVVSGYVTWRKAQL